MCLWSVGDRDILFLLEVFLSFFALNPWIYDSNILDILIGFAHVNCSWKLTDQDETCNGAIRQTVCDFIIKKVNITWMLIIKIKKKLGWIILCVI